MVDAYSSVAEIKQATVAKVDDITDELAKWNYLTLYTTEMTVASSCSASDCSGSGGDYDWF